MNSNRINTLQLVSVMRRSLPAAVGALCATCTGFAGPAYAIAEGDIVLGDVTVIRLRTDSGGVSAAKRASMVQERVNLILAVPNLTAKDVTIVATKYGPTIYVHKIKLITVDPDTAKDQGMTPDALAHTWAHRLMGVIDQVDVRVPTGQGAAAGGPTAPVTPGSPTPTPGPATPGTPALPTPAPNPAGPATPTPGTPAPATPAPASPIAPPPTPPTPGPAGPDPAPTNPAPAVPAPAPPAPAPPTP